MQGESLQADPSTMGDVELERNLEQLFATINELEQSPTNVPLLRRNLELATECGIHEQVVVGREMLAKATGCTPELWLKIFESIQIQMSQLQDFRVSEIEILIEKALSDYVSPVVASKIATLLECCYPAPSLETSTAQQVDGPVRHFTEEQARKLWKSTVAMIENDMSMSETVWTAYIKWEEAVALQKDEQEREAALKAVQGRYIAHLAVPHNHLEETSALCSSFNTAHLLQDYEANMIKASTVAAKSASKWQLREQWEQGWNIMREESSTDETVRTKQVAYLSAWLDMELSLPETSTKQKFKGREQEQSKLDPRCVVMAYERLLSVLCYWREQAGRASEAAVWLAYHRFMTRTNGISKAEATRVLQRGVRCCPGSGDLWSTWLAHHESTSKDITIVSQLYENAILQGELTQTAASASTKLGRPSVDQLVALELAMCGCTSRILGGHDQDDDDDMDNEEDLVESTLRASLARVKSIYPKGDPLFKLESFLLSRLEDKGKVEEAMAVWEDVSKQHPKVYRVWTAYADFLIRHQEHNKARSILKIAANRQGFDWPEAIWDLWISFETRYGSIESLMTARNKIAELTEALTKKRMEAMSQTQGLDVQPAALVEPLEQSDEVAPTVKRKAEEAVQPEQEETKRRKVEEGEAQAPVLQRDREFSTVLVSGMAPEATEAMVRELFADCGEIRDVTITEKDSGIMAAIEFVERDSVLPALTKDKKKVGEAPVHVYQAGQTTLFVTNFPEGTDDDHIRALFAPHGEIFETRWPSKKYKDSRRFCYVQFLTTAAAHSACELNGRELEPGIALTVLISEPERKKPRSDANAESREVYITGLSKFVAEKDIRRLFGPFGDIKRVVLPTDEEDHCKGFAFVEYTEEAAIRSALLMDGTELKKRKMRVKQVDPNVKKSNNPAKSAPPPERANEIIARSIRLTGLPDKTQEGLLQQTLEKITKVEKVEVFADQGFAQVRLTSPAEVGKLVLRTEGIEFGGTTLQIEALADGAPPPKRNNAAPPGARDAASKPPTQAAPSLRPRPPKLGGRKKVLAMTAPSASSKARPSQNSDTSATVSSGMKGQDDFRKMLLGSKKTDGQ